MLRPRTTKIIRDILAAKTRTLLVVLSIAVGVCAVGMIAGTRSVLGHAMAEAQTAIAPPAAILSTDEFDDELVQTVRAMPGVRDAEGRRTVSVRLSVGPGAWRNLQLTAIGDYRDIRLGKLYPVAGAWPPRARELLIERASLEYLGAEVGATCLVETSDGRQRQLRIAGTVHDPGKPAADLEDLAYGYVSLDTLESLGEPRSFNELHIAVDGNPNDAAAIRRVANQVRDKIEASGRTVYRTHIPEPGKHWADETIHPLLLLLGALGALSLLLSGFLVINTIQALLAQQVRQIGVMKAIGGRAGQIGGMYLGMVLILSLLALGLAVPLGAAGAYGLTAFIGGLLNVGDVRFSIAPRVLALEAAAGLLVPLLAALYPILKGTRVTVREAINAEALDGGRRRGTLLDRAIERVPAVLHAVSRPLLLSLRNTFRRRVRLLLTLATLTLAGATFVAVFSVRDSLVRTLDDAYAGRKADLYVFWSRPYRVAAIEQEARAVPGVAGVEGWGLADAPRVRRDDSESNDIRVVGLPAGTDLFTPTMLRGRWLLPDDSNAVVVTTDLLKVEPDLQVGDDLVLKIKGRPVAWRVVGVAQVVLAGPKVYVNHPYYAQVMGEVGRAVFTPVVTEQHDPASQLRVAQALEEHFKDSGLHVNATQTVAQEREGTEFQFNILVVFLLIMALLLGIVGSLGLAGTMSINVLERTREIGVLRAIGASDGSVQRIVLAEGVLIGLLSWLLGSVLALPLGRLLSDQVGTLFLNGPLSYSYSVAGAALWLAAVLALSAAASSLPAWRASRLTIRTALAYE